MLILTRRVGETVMIGSDVTVTVLGVKGNQVRIGVNARIKREEEGGQDARHARPGNGQDPDQDSFP